MASHPATGRNPKGSPQPPGQPSHANNIECENRVEPHAMMHFFRRLKAPQESPLINAKRSA